MTKRRRVALAMVCALDGYGFPAARTVAAQAAEDDPIVVLSPAQWRRIDGSVERALKWIATQQRDDGLFRAPDKGQSAITGLCVFAFLSSGHLLGNGPHGAQLDRAIDYIISCQRRDGLFSRIQKFRNATDGTDARVAAVYNHAITGLALCETHGMGGEHAIRSTDAIERALGLTRTMQDWRKSRGYAGGWRHLHRPSESDRSVTSWQLMFLRSARNAGFDARSERIDRAMKYVKSCYDRRSRGFRYSQLHPGVKHPMTGGGILALAQGGMFDTEMAQRAGDWLLDHRYAGYQEGGTFHYGVFYSVAAVQAFVGVQAAAGTPGNPIQRVFCPCQRWRSVLGSSAVGQPA